MEYLRNTWYVAAWDNEVLPGEILARRFLGEATVLFRDAEGRVQALGDKCPHRMAPLRRGTIVEGALQCGYHGLRFDGTGACVHSPFGAPPKGAAAHAYPVVERHSMIWIWMGAPELADPALIPDFAFQDPQVAYVGKDYLKVNARYELEIENILDLSHIEFLHPTTLGSGQVSSGKYECVQDADVVWSNREVLNELMNDELSTAMGITPGTRADRWIHVRWSAPSNLVIFAGATQAGLTKAEGQETPTAHLFTPETATSSHYWFSVAYPKAGGPELEAMAQKQIQYLRMPFETEDAPMLEDQQANVGEGDLWELKWAWLPGDAAGARARNILRQKIQDEQGGAPAAAEREMTPA